MRANLVDQKAVGDVVLERFDKQPEVPAEIEPSLTDFRTKHLGLKSLSEAVDKACLVRDGALETIGAEDAALDRSFETTITQMIGCKVTSRRQPLAGYSNYMPSEITSLAYAKEVSTVREVLAKVAAGGPPAAVTSAIGECLQQAAKVELALTTLAGPQSDYDQKRAARDTAAMGWSKAFAKLKLRSKAAYVDSPATFEALFAPPEGVQRPVTRRPRKAKEPQKTESPESPK